MVKKLQALKAKKGFTLVELIVVIAIIGVLAAILVPTMMGMVTKSRVTSADQTAEALAKTITTWMSDLESNRGTIPSSTVGILIKGKATYDAATETNSWDGTVYAEGFAAANDTNYAEESVAAGSYADKGGKKAVEKLKSTLANDYNFNSEITALIYVSGRKVIGCAYVDTGVSEVLTNVFKPADFRSNAYKWDGKTDGIMGDGDLSGRIVGTNPKLLMDNVTSSAA